MKINIINVLKIEIFDIIFSFKIFKDYLENTH